MEKAKRKHRPNQPAWEFTTGYSLAECVERLEHLKESSENVHQPVSVYGIQPQDDGLYTFMLRSIDVYAIQPHGDGSCTYMLRTVHEFETPGCVEELPDGTTRFYGEYHAAGYLYIVIPALIMLLIIVAPFLYFKQYNLCLIMPAIGLMAIGMLAIYSSRKPDMRMTARLLEDALTGKKHEFDRLSRPITDDFDTPEAEEQRYEHRKGKT